MGGAVPVLTLLPSRAGVLEPKSREVSGSKFKKGKGKIMCRIISHTFQDGGTTVIQIHYAASILGQFYTCEFNKLDKAKQS